MPLLAIRLALWPVQRCIHIAARLADLIGQELRQALCHATAALTFQWFALPQLLHLVGSLRLNAFLIYKPSEQVQYFVPFERR